MEFLTVLSKATTQATDEDIRAGFAGLEPEEQKFIEAMLLARKGDHTGQQKLLKECAEGTSQAVAAMATTILTVGKEAHPAPPKFFEPEGDLSRVLGQIKWSLREAPSFDVVDRGEMQVKLSDFFIQLIENKDRPLIGKVVRINEEFAFQLSCSPTGADAKSGFGFSARNLAVPSFCWEWFVVDRPGHANKLQEEGEVSFEVRDNEGFDIVETKFLKDLSLRIARFGIDNDPRSPHWRLVIAAGSQMTWPALIDGKIVI